MDNGLKIITLFLIISTGCTVIAEASGLRCYLQSIDDYEEYESSDIEKMMSSPYFNTNLRTFIFVHGFNASEDGYAINTIIPAAINKGGWNVCLWNWIKESGAFNLLGTAGSYTAEAVGVTLSEGKKFGGALAKVAGYVLSEIHVYGHSLGAHLAGYAGVELKVLDAPPIGWIVGLDPARIFFGKLGPGRHLRSGDASFVMSLHTDPGNNGNNASYCDIDSWANLCSFYSSNPASRQQPGCFQIQGYCSHNFAVALAAASFTVDFPMSFGNTYWEWASSDGAATPTTVFGEKVDTTLRGNYFLSTSGESPYSLGLDGLRTICYTS